MSGEENKDLVHWEIEEGYQAGNHHLQFNHELGVREGVLCRIDISMWMI